MGIGGSHHTYQGWQGQFKRVKRWHQRVQKIGRAISRSSNLEEEHDIVYAFFQNCHHLKDWLKYSGTLPKEELNDFFKKHIELQICRDICIGTKHFNISNPSVDSDLSIVSEYVERSSTELRPYIIAKWVVLVGGIKYDIFELADKCIELWDDFLREKN